MQGKQASPSRQFLDHEICLVITSLDGGGAERVCAVVASAWAALGRKVLLVVLRRRGPFLAALHPGVDVVSLDRDRARNAALALVRLFARTRRTMPVLAFGFEFGVVLGLLKRMHAIANPVIYREGNSPCDFISPYRRWLYGIAIACCEGSIAQAHCIREQLKSLGVAAGSIAVMLNPVQPAGDSAPRALPPRPSGPVLISVGRLARQKGFDRLLQAFADSGVHLPGARLLIAGEGSELGHLQSQVGDLGLANRVEFTGFVNDPVAACRQADLFVLASHYEGQPNALLEALLGGCRVLAAGGAPVRELLETLGLGECYLEATDFGPPFGRKVGTVLQMPPARWQQARVRLAELTNPAYAAECYWNFCHRAGKTSPEGSVV